MIDSIFAIIEDIYFQVIDDSTPENLDTESKISLTDATLTPLIDEFKMKSRNIPYKGVTGNQFKLLKIAGYMLNYVVYGDDGVITEDEHTYINKLVKSKFNKLTESERHDLLQVFDNRATLNDIEQYIISQNLHMRSLDMILMTLIDQIQDENRYFLPLESIYKMLLSKF